MSSKALAVIAFIVLGAGALTGFIPVSSQGANCGSAFVESRDASVSDLTDAFMGQSGNAAETCKDLRSIVRIPALVLLGVGLVVWISSGLVTNKKPVASTPEPAEGK